MTGLKEIIRNHMIEHYGEKSLDGYPLAYHIAEYAHYNQKRVNGSPYFVHPISMFENYESFMCLSYKELDKDLHNELGIPLYGVIDVILLHDVVEDTDITFEDIRDYYHENRHGKFYDYCVDKPLRLITHDKNDDYDTYIEKVMSHPISAFVKMIDLIDNSNLFTLNKLDDEEYQRTLRYITYFKRINDEYHFVEKIYEYRNRI